MIYRRFDEDSFKDAIVFPFHISLMAPQANADEHQHDFQELVLVLKGQGEHFGGGWHCTVRERDIFLIPRRFSHGYRNGSSDFSLINILFIPEALPLPPLDMNLIPSFSIFYRGKSFPDSLYPEIHASGEDFESIRVLALELLDEYRSKRFGYVFCSMGIFMLLLCRIVRIHSRNFSVERRYIQHISGVISYLNTNYRKEITVSQLCRVAGMSRSSLMRNFTNATGNSPLQYLIRLRVSEAMRMLCFSRSQIAEIAFETGFQDCNYFCRQFKKITGKSPSDFRKRAAADLKKKS